MHTADRNAAIKYLRSIAVLAIQCAEVLEGVRKDTRNSPDDTLAETMSAIEGDCEAIDKLEIWEYIDA